MNPSGVIVRLPKTAALLWASAVLWAVHGPLAEGATYTWNGGAGTWTTAGAWSGSTWANGNDALFVGAGGTVATTSGGTANGITFASTAGNYTLSLNVNFLIGSGGVTANQDATIAQANYIFPVVASSTQTWTVASGKTLTMDFGATTSRVNNGVGTVLTKAGDGTLAIKAGFAGGGFDVYSGNTFRLTAGRVTIATPAPNLTSNGTFTISGGEFVTGSAATTGDLGGAGTFNLDGGVVSNVRRFYNASGTATFNFNGGVIRSGTNYSGSDFFASAATLNVKAGGAIFDTNGFNVDVNRQFTEDPTSTGGGFVKQGPGTLTLGFSGTQGYTGETRVDAGVLALSANARLASTRLNVVSGTFNYSAAVAAALPTLTRLSGGGTILAPAAATITVGSSGTLALGGTTLGTLAITASSGTANLSLNAASTTTIRLGSSGTSYSNPGNSDRVTLTGSLGLGGTINLVNDANSSGQGSAAGGTYRIATFGSSGGSMTIGTNIDGTRALVTNQGSGTAAGKGLFVDVYNLASATSAQTVSVGNMYAGSTQTVAVTLTNTAPSNPTYTEMLSGSFSGVTTGFSATGSASGITGQSSGSGTLLVGFGNTLTAGVRTGTASLALFSNAVNSSGLAQQSVGSQAVTITGTVWNPAAVNAITTPISLGNVRVGGTFGTSALSIQNTAAAGSYTEVLGATGSTSGSASLTGVVSGLAGGGTSTAISVGLGGNANTGSAGVKSGSATISFTSTGGPGTAVIAPQTLAVSGTVWNTAAASTLSGSINLGTVLKGTSLSQALSITNTAPNDGYSEKLDAAFGTLLGNATTNSGSISLLAAGGTSTALSVGLGSATAGAKSGSVQVNFTSNGAGTSGLGTFNLSPQTVTLSATVLDPAVASFTSGSTTTSLLLDFGSVNQNASVSPLAFDLFNLVQTGSFTADLALIDILSGTGNTGAITTTLSTFNNLAAGVAPYSYTASLATGSLGAFTNTYTLQFKSANASTVYSGDSTQSMTLTVTGAIVVPEPGSIALAGIGVGLAGWSFWRRRRGLAGSPLDFQAKQNAGSAPE